MEATPPTNETATTYLTSLLNKTLHVHTSDERTFVGSMKCTDKDRNIILAMTHEYRDPSPQMVRDLVREHDEAGKQGTVKIERLRRFVGLVVVPGEHIERIEVE